MFSAVLGHHRFQWLSGKRWRNILTDNEALMGRGQILAAVRLLRYCSDIFIQKAFQITITLFKPQAY